MKNISMDTPSTRAEFEKRMHYIKEKMMNGQVSSAIGLRGIDGLLKVRLLPNGRIELLSIDESARSMANLMYQMRNTELENETTIHQKEREGSDN